MGLRIIPIILKLSQVRLARSTVLLYWKWNCIIDPIILTIDEGNTVKMLTKCIVFTRVINSKEYFSSHPRTTKQSLQKLSISLRQKTNLKMTGKFFRLLRNRWRAAGTRKAIRIVKQLYTKQCTPWKMIMKLIPKMIWLFMPNFNIIYAKFVTYLCRAFSSVVSTGNFLNEKFPLENQ